MDGCEVFFQITENETCTISKISVQIALLNLQDNERLPLHFIQYITKTEKGRAFLASKNILQHAKSVLENKESIAQDMRAVLWSIGYYGSTQEGMGDLLREGIADLVV